MSSTLDYNSLLEITSKLDLDDTINVISSLPGFQEKEDVWQSLIHLKYNLQVRNASKEDYILLATLTPTRYEEEASNEVFTLIKEGLREKEENSTGEVKIWTPNTRCGWDTDSTGVFIHAKTLAGVILKFHERNSMFLQGVYEEGMEKSIKSYSQYLLSRKLKEVMSRVKKDPSLPDPIQTEEVIPRTKKELTDLFLYNHASMDGYEGGAFFSVYPHITMN